MKENLIIKSDNFQVVEFNAAKIVCPIINGKPFFVVKCISDEIKMNYKAVTRAVKNHPRFKSRVTEWCPVKPVNGFSNKHNYPCLPIEKIAAWLYSINMNFVTDETKPFLEEYQEKCDEVLFDHFFGGKNSVISFQEKRLPLLTERKTKEAELKKANEDLQKTKEYSKVEQLKKEISQIKRKESRIQKEFFPDPQLEIQHEES